VTATATWQRNSGCWSWKAAVCFLCSFDSFHAAGGDLIGACPGPPRWHWLAVEEVLGSQAPPPPLAPAKPPC
jgi:hypothetical protein